MLRYSRRVMWSKGQTKMSRLCSIFPNGWDQGNMALVEDGDKDETVIKM